MKLPHPHLSGPAHVTSLSQPGLTGNTSQGILMYTNPILQLSFN